MKTKDKRLVELIRLYQQHKIIERAEKNEIYLIIRILKKALGMTTKRGSIEIQKLLAQAEQYLIGAISASTSFVKTDTLKILSWDGAINLESPPLIGKAELMALIASNKQILGGKQGKTLHDYFNTLYDKKQKLFMGASLLAGKNPKVAARSMEVKSMASTKRDIEAIIRTFNSYYTETARQQVFDANKEAISGYEWSAALENGSQKTGRGTCKACAALDGEKYKTKDEAPSIPRHMSCRCQLKAVTKSWDELLKLGRIDQESMDKVDKIAKTWNIRNQQLSSRAKQYYGLTGSSYSEWWKTLPRATQEATIGKVRARLILDMKAIRFRDMVDKNGNIILLDNLVSKEQLKIARSKVGN